MPDSRCQRVISHDLDPFGSITTENGKTRFFSETLNSRTNGEFTDLGPFPL